MLKKSQNQKTIVKRQISSNSESQKQENNNSLAQNGKFLTSLNNLNQKIEELKNNQSNVSDCLTNNLAQISKKIDEMESFIKELSSQPFSTSFDFPKNKNIIFDKSQTMRELIWDQKQNNQEHNSSLQMVYSNQQTQVVKRQLDIQQMMKQIPSKNIVPPNDLQEQNLQKGGRIKNIFNYQQKCLLCSEKSSELIETQCHHFFHKKCLKQEYNKQLMDYEDKKQFYCICKKELNSNLFLSKLQIDRDTLFKKQLQIIQQKYKNKLKQCKWCNFFWIYDIFQKTYEYCFECGQLQY